MHFGLPVIQDVSYNQLTEDEKQRLRRHGSPNTQFNEASIIYSRGSFIIGYESDGFIRQVASQHNEMNVIYDRVHRKFEQLSQEQIELLGVNNRRRLADQVDLIVASYRSQLPSTSGLNEHLTAIVTGAQAQATYAGMVRAVRRAHLQAGFRNQNDDANQRAIYQAFDAKFDSTYKNILRENGLV